MTVGRCFTPVSMWDGYYVRFDHVAQDTHPFWTRRFEWTTIRLTSVGRLCLTTLQPQLHSSLTRATYSTGLRMSGSPYSAFSSRFCPLITSRQAGDDAVSRTISAVGLDEAYQISLIAPTSIYSYKGQWLGVPCRPSPVSVDTVSDERVAPKPCT